MFIDTHTERVCVDVNTRTRPPPAPPPLPPAPGVTSSPLNPPPPTPRRAGEVPLEKDSNLQPGDRGASGSGAEERGNQQAIQKTKL